MDDGHFNFIALTLKLGFLLLGGGGSFSCLKVEILFQFES